MSRLIVKNLPEKIKEQKLREIFTASGGEITDLKLCYTKNGVFRKFAFIGYRTEGDAKAALEYNNKTYINTSKIEVQICKDLYDPTIPRPWSRHSKESSAFMRKDKETRERKDRLKELQLGKEEKSKSKEKIKKKDKVLKEIGDVADEVDFQEFLAVHSKKNIWSNESLKTDSAKEVTDDTSTKVEEKLLWEDEDEESDTDDDKNVNASISNRDVKITSPKSSEVSNEKSATSDLDWLKTKVTKSKGESSASSEKTDNKEQYKSRQQDSSSSSDSDSDSKDTSSDEVNDSDGNKNRNSKAKLEKQSKKKKKVNKADEVTTCTLKLRGVPFKGTEEDVLNFFKPIFIEDIRFPKDKNGRPSGYAFVDFKTKEDTKEALKLDGKKMKGRYIEMFPEKNVESSDAIKNKLANMSNDGAIVSELGRLFVRNLPFTCTEVDLEAFFSKYGELTEVNLPIDKNSNKVVGFAFLSFKLPENAVTALNETNGKIFQGRILQVLPGKEKKSRNEERHSKEFSTTFKKEKEAKQKALSSSSHNWNALFLGANAVAGVMADRFNTTKKNILDTEGPGSVAVRMALGETELVSDTRDFLESHGVKLDVFGQANSARSKTVLLVKNLPPGTTTNELEEIFTKHGDLGRLLMPPFGITAIVEYVQAKDAKNAFTNLAYSKFKHTPLYLEWAPVDVLSGEVTAKTDDDKEKVEDKEDEESDEEDIEPGTTIFVKNLNFDTTDEKLKELFSRCGKLRNVTVAKKKDARKPDIILSMGYGFVEFKKQQAADKAMKLLQGVELDGHKLELKKSHRETIAPKSARKRAAEKEQSTSKIIVRNIPFEATEKEIIGLFSSFGHIKSLRLPKKMAGTGSHRGFAFVDFTTKQDAKRAFKALCQSTHLYGRRLVLEWADEDESIDMLRQKTARHFHEEPQAKKRKGDMISSLEKTSKTAEGE